MSIENQALENQISAAIDLYSENKDCKNHLLTTTTDYNRKLTGRKW